MKLEHSFTVPTGIDEAWQILLDIERIGPCMPGAAITSVDGDDFTGTVKVKLGPIGLTYKGKASFIDKDEAAHRAVIDARGRDSRGNGTAAAKVTAVLESQGDRTLVKVDTDLDITGKPAQFGRGVMVDVGNKLIGQFADNLAATISSGDAAPITSGDAAPITSGDAAPAATARTRPKAAPATAEASGAADEAPVLSGTAEPEAPTAGEVAATAGPIERAAVEAVAAGPGYSAPTETTAATPTPAVEGAGTGVNGHQPNRPTIPAREVEPINLIESAGPAVAKRLAPVAALLILVLIVLRRRAKR